MSRKYFFLISVVNFILFSSAVYSQGADPEHYLKDTTEIRNMTEQNRSRASINGVYIPSDVEDAVKRLKELSPPESIEKFKNAPEEGIDRKLHFGIGRWMTVNWYFYEGSRLEYKLRQIGLSNPDDMADFLIVCFHRHLNGKDLDMPILAGKYAENRRKDLLDRKKIIDTSEFKATKKEENRK